MGLFLKKYVEKDVLWGIWKIEESFDELFSMVQLDEEDTEKLHSFGNEKRKIEWLSVRHLISLLREKPSKIIYNEDRKPFLANNGYNISISHSHNFTSIMLSKHKKVGIDLEYMSHDIRKIASKFMHEDEYISKRDDDGKYHLYIHWCAKEALYKICDKQDIIFKENLFIDAFEPEQQGVIKGTVNNKYGIENYVLNYTLIDNYSIVWCTK